MPILIPLKKVGSWFSTALGQELDPDKAYDLQCVDVVDHYAEYIFPGVPWEVSVGGVEGAKDLLRSANPKYWQIIPNKPDNPRWIPLRGDVVVFGGTAANPYGHTAVCESSSINGMWVYQQNADGQRNTGVKREWLPYWGPGTGMITGWLRPRKAILK